MRYFIVFYQTLGLSEIFLSTFKGDFPNLKDRSKEALSKSRTPYWITNIIELNETDFNSFIK